MLINQTKQTRRVTGSRLAGNDVDDVTKQHTLMYIMRMNQSDNNDNDDNSGGTSARTPSTAKMLKILNYNFMLKFIDFCPKKC